MVVQLKCCPKCVGDVFLEHGVHGEEWVCIQCGYRYEILVISRTRVVNGGRRIGIVQPAEAFDVRFDRAADGDLSRIDWASRSNRELPQRVKGPHKQNNTYQQVVEAAEAAADGSKITTLRGAA